MRVLDRRECLALGLSPKDALRKGLLASLYVWTVLDESETPAGMFGLVAESMLGGSARPWLLGTDRMFAYGRELLTIGRQVLAEWQAEFPHLENIISVENRRAIRLLERWGASVGGQEQVYRGLAFVPFTIQAQATNA